jgi:hypothetical protein
LSKAFFIFLFSFYLCFFPFAGFSSVQHQKEDSLSISETNKDSLNITQDDFFTSDSSQITLSVDSVAKIVQYDTTKCAIRMISATKLNGFRNSSDFQYDTSIEIPVDFWDIIKYYLSQWFLKFFNTAHPFHYVWYIIFILFVTYLFLKIYKSDAFSFFYKSGVKAGLDFNQIETDISTIDFDTLIQENISNGQFRIAVRHLYLKLLKLFNRFDVIDWKKNKTNRDYIREVSKSKYKEIFISLTFLYDYFWYGNFEIDEQAFKTAKSKFETVFSEFKQVDEIKN